MKIFLPLFIIALLTIWAIYRLTKNFADRRRLELAGWEKKEYEGDMSGWGGDEIELYKKPYDTEYVELHEAVEIQQYLDSRKI